MKGGKREGSGRKPVGSHRMTFVVPDDIYEWLSSYRSSRSMSSAVTAAIREFMSSRK